MSTTNNLVYFVQPNKYVLSDTDACAPSSRTIDIPFNNLANNQQLLNLLELYYIQGNFGTTYTERSRALWFAGYLAAFCENNSRKAQQINDKLMTNPTVRLLILDEKLYEKINLLNLTAKKKYNYKCTKCSSTYVDMSKPLDYDLCEVSQPTGGNAGMQKCRGRLIEVKENSFAPSPLNLYI